MAATALDMEPADWTDDEWTENLQQVLNVLGVMRGMKQPEIADAMAMPRSTFYDKVKKGSFTARELRRAATALSVPVSVFYEPVDSLFTGGLRTGSFPSGLFALPEPSGDQGALLDDDGYPLDFWSRPFLTPV